MLCVQESRQESLTVTQEATTPLRATPTYILTSLVYNDWELSCDESRVS